MNVLVKRSSPLRFGNEVKVHLLWMMLSDTSRFKGGWTTDVEKSDMEYPRDEKKSKTLRSQVSTSNLLPG